MVLTNTFLRNNVLAAGFSEVAFYNVVFILMNAQKCCLQKQLKRREILKYQKVLASIVGPV